MKRLSYVLLFGFLVPYFVKCQYSNYGSSGNSVQIKIAGIFDDGDSLQETVLKDAVQRVNQDPSILPDYHLVVRPETIPQQSSFHTTRAVCSVIRDGIAVVFGPQSPEAGSHTQALCDRYDIPHVETQWNYRTRADKYAINLAPYPETLGRAYRDLVEEWEWDYFVIIYDHEAGLDKLQELIKFVVPPKRRVLIRQLPLDDNFRPLLKSIQREMDIKNILVDADMARTIMLLTQAQQVGMTNFEYHYILTTLDLHTWDLEEFKYGDADFLAFRIVDPARCEVQSVVRELNLRSEENLPRKPACPFIRDSRPYYGNTQATPARGLTTQLALVYDAVKLFGMALHKHEESINKIRSLECDEDEAWTEGTSIVNDMRTMPTFQGLTGFIQFNNSGYRTDITLDVVKLSETGLSKVGTWEYSRSNTRFNWLEEDEEPQSPDAISAERPLYNQTLKVTTFLMSAFQQHIYQDCRTMVIAGYPGCATGCKNKPFCMYTLSDKPLEGNDRFEGFSIDLVKELAKELHFKFEIQLVADETYPGMIQEVRDGKADMVVADLAINKVRQEVVDFTMPFMNLGISILYRKPSAKSPSLFSFMSPFAPIVWLYVAVAFFGVSFSLFFIGRLTPYEWDNPLPCIADPDVLHNQFSLLNSFWFTIGSIMQQGSDLAPNCTLQHAESYSLSRVDRLNSSHGHWKLTFQRAKGDWSQSQAGVLALRNFSFPATSMTLGQMLDPRLPVYGLTLGIRAVSTRMIAGIWWFFTLIMVSSYTANLATFLIVQELHEPIKTLEDLAAQKTIEYGCVKGGSTQSFFSGSNATIKKQIWDNMLRMKNVLKSNNQEGIDQVLETDGKFAFFVESSIIEYYVERSCSLAQVGGLLDNKGYGIALKKGSQYLGKFNRAVLTLQELGKLDELKRKWWKEQRKETNCASASPGDSVNPLKLANVGGVFVVLVGGCIVSIMLAIFEFLWKSRQIPVNEGETRFQEIIRDLQFALQCRGNVKQVKKPSMSMGTGEGMGSTPYLGYRIDSLDTPAGFR